LPIGPPFEDAEIQDAAQALEGRTPLEILSWASARFAPRIALATAFGAEGCVLLDLIGRHRLPIDAFTLDTGLLFPETIALWRESEARHGVRVRAVRPDQSVEEQAGSEGERLWEHAPDRCCELRKVIPLGRELVGLDAWITSVRREQTGVRATARVVERDARFGLVKVNPLAAWSSAEVWEYLRANDVPYNSLHDRGYPSVGCIPCTGKVAPGEDARAGRWRGKEKTECGLHTRPTDAGEGWTLTLLRKRGA
jgi:phosphoadenosine phosphosulfate reductase